jgi:hypothetical protein
MKDAQAAFALDLEAKVREARSEAEDRVRREVMARADESVRELRKHMKTLSLQKSSRRSDVWKRKSVVRNSLISRPRCRLLKRAMPRRSRSA